MDYFNLINKTTEIIHSFNPIISTIDGHIYDTLHIKDGDVLFYLFYLLGYK